MATSLASQLQAIKSIIQTGDSSDQPTKRPFTKPSILFDPKQAADIDLQTILNLALSGLAALVEKDARFRAFQDSLFSYKSRDVNRELMTIEENNQINDSISSYLRLLSPHLQLVSALRTLEYLIRRYKAQVYNVEELILCALPYHDTHVFVRIVQLMDFGNSKWGFLNGVKTSGAPPPRNVIVQQCIRDMGVFDSLCKYASPTKKFHPSVLFLSFFTAVVVEMLGALPTIDSDTLRRVLPFVLSTLASTTKGGRDHKAGALMLVGLLANRAILAPKPVKALIESIARVAQQDAKESADLNFLRLLLMTIIILVQSQSIQSFPEKPLKSLMEIRDFTGVLLGLSKEFNLKKFLSVYLESLANYSSSDAYYRPALVSAIETLPVKDFISSIVVTLLTSFLMLSKKMEKFSFCESGFWVKQLLATIGAKYPSDLRETLCSFSEDLKLKSRKEDSMYENLCLLLEGNMDVSQGISDSVILLSLENPKAEVRRATLYGLALSGVVKPRAIDSQKHATIKETILQRLHDEDLSVVQAALSLKDLSSIVDTPKLIEAFRDTLIRCIHIGTSLSFITSGYCDVAVSCLDSAIFNLKHQPDYTKELAAIIFPLLIVFPKTWKLNRKALELAKDIQWPLYSSIRRSYDLISIVQDKKLDPSLLTSINTTTVRALAEAFLTHSEEYMPWLIECCNSFALSKTLLFLVVLESLTIQKEDFRSLSALFEVCFEVLKREWCDLESTGDILLDEKFTVEKLDWDCNKFLNQLLSTTVKSFNADLLICIFWMLLKAFISMDPPGSSVENEQLVHTVEDLFVFVSTSRLKDIFKEHLHLLLMKCNPTPFGFLSKFFTEEGFALSVQVESLLTFASICSQSASLDKSINRSHLQLLIDFPSILVPLSSDRQELRIAAMKCIERLYALWHQIDISTGRNGNGNLLPNSIWSPSLGEFLGLLVQQKRLILSDRNFLQSFLTAALNSSCLDILVPQSTDQRFDQRTREAIFLFIVNYALKLPAFGKFMVLSLLRGMGNSIAHAEGVKSLLSELLVRRIKYHMRNDKSYEALSNIEIDTLCLLLEACASPSASMVRDIPFDHFVAAVQVNGLLTEDPAVVRPCLTILQKLDSSLYNCLKTEMQDQLFRELLFLFRNGNGAIHNAAKEALLQINVSSSTVEKLLDFLILEENCLSNLSNGRKRKKLAKEHSFDLTVELFNKKESRLSFLGSLVDVLLLKKDIENRASMTGSLFELLRKIFSDKWLLGFVEPSEKLLEASSGISENTTSRICYIQQAVLLILEDISAFLVSDIPQKDDILRKFDVKLLVECARNSKDAKTRNHVFSLISSISRVVPDRVLDHTIDIFTVIGESAVTQSDSHSQSVLENLISTIAPFWLSSENNTEKLLQIFINVLPEIPEDRRLTVIVYLLRTLGETTSLASLFFLLVRSLVSRRSKSWSAGVLHSSESFGLFVRKEWEYEFAMHVCAQYSCLMWLPPLVLLLEKVKTDSNNQDQMSELLIVMHFIQHKLQDTELVFKLESGEDRDSIQMTLGALMEQVASHSQLINSRSKLFTVPVGIKKELNDCVNTVLKTITKGMVPEPYLRSINLLLQHADRSVRKKALRLLSETVNDSDLINPKGKKRGQVNQRSSTSWIHMNESSWEIFGETCLKIVQLVDCSSDDSDNPVKLAAISALEVLARKFPSNSSMFTSCLTPIVKQIDSQNLALSSSSFRTLGALINVLGPKALTELPQIMERLLRRAGDAAGLEGEMKFNDERSATRFLGLKESFLTSVLVTLEAVVDKLGSFLNPYLGAIIDLMVLHPEYISGSDPKIKVKADTVRRLITEKIPVRLTLPPLLKSYSRTVKSGESSVSTAFHMLATIISAMDRSSTASYHVRIYEHCLQALDLRRERPLSVKNVHIVEQSVINAMVLLTMKLTEIMFKPLFVRSLEWAESKVERSGTTDIKDFDRTISFYILVNKLAENQRSLFVPYFKYLVESCMRYLMDDEDTQLLGLAQKKKRAKIDGADSSKKVKDKVLSVKQWHLRALIISAFHKCFVYDTESVKFLDQLNFQVLLKPIVSQLVTEPPTFIEELSDVPSVEVVDESLIACLGQMAVTAGSDLLWKPLNHEVLMQTRSEKTRPRILGLRVVKYFLEHLKEEYLVLLPETIPFLGELLEDMELPVKSLAQEILKEMETLSGESLQQYL